MQQHPSSLPYPTHNNLNVPHVTPLASRQSPQQAPSSLSAPPPHTLPTRVRHSSDLSLSMDFAQVHFVGMESGNTEPFLQGSFPCAFCLRDLSVVLHTSAVCSLPLRCDIAWHEHTAICSSSLTSVDLGGFHLESTMKRATVHSALAIFLWGDRSPHLC